MSKTLSFGVMHMTVAFVVVWLMTGSILVGGAVALVEPAVNTVAYHFHEKIWSRRQPAADIRRSPLVTVQSRLILG